MSSNSWKCRVLRTPDGGVVMNVPEDLAKALRITPGDELQVDKARNGFFDLWKVEPPLDPEVFAERLIRLRRNASRKDAT